MATTTVVLRGLPKLAIRLREMVEDIPNTGIMIGRARGDAVVLNEGVYEIDVEFWEAWAKQNATTDFVTKSYIFEAKKD